MKRWTSSLAVLCLLAVFTTFSVAQGGNQGTIEGTVVDASGAVIAGASLTATNQATGTQFTAKTNEDGLFVFPVLPVGTYDLKVEQSGFAPLTRKDIMNSRSSSRATWVSSTA